MQEKKEWVKVPDKKDIDEFIKRFNQEAEKQLVKGEEVSCYQQRAIEKHGVFFALVGRENFKSVASKIVTELKNYNFAVDKVKKVMIDNLEKESITHLKRSKKFRDNLVEVYKNPYNKEEEESNYNLFIENYVTKQEIKYKEFIELFDLYINDLENVVSDINYDIRKCKILPAEQFAKIYKKHKTDIKYTFQNIVKKYNIKGYSAELEKLIHFLDNPC